MLSFTVTLDELDGCGLHEDLTAKLEAESQLGILKFPELRLVDPQDLVLSFSRVGGPIVGDDGEHTGRYDWHVRWTHRNDGESHDVGTVLWASVSDAVDFLFNWPV